MPLKWHCLSCLMILGCAQEGIDLVQLSRGGSTSTLHVAGDAPGARLQLLSMKETVLGLMRVPEEAVPFLENIGNLLKGTLMNFLLNERATDKKQHDDLIGRATNASNAYDKAILKVQDRQKSLTSARDSYNECRGAPDPNNPTKPPSTESMKFKEFDMCKGQEVEAQKDYAKNLGQQDAAGAAIGCDAEDDIWLVLEFLDSRWDDLSTGLNKTASAVYELKLKEEDCRQRNITFQNAIAECNVLHDGQMNETCEYSAEVLSAITTYKPAFDADKNKFDTDLPFWQAQSEERSLQCQLIKLLQCYVTGLTAHDDKSDLQNGVNLCDQEFAAKYDCSEVEFVPDSWPEQSILKDIPATCHDTEWRKNKKEADWKKEFFGFVFHVGTDQIDMPGCPVCNARDELPGYVVVSAPDYLESEPLYIEPSGPSNGGALDLKPTKPTQPSQQQQPSFGGKPIKPSFGGNPQANQNR